MPDLGAESPRRWPGRRDDTGGGLVIEALSVRLGEDTAEPPKASEPSKDSWSEQCPRQVPLSGRGGQEPCL